MKALVIAALAGAAAHAGLTATVQVAAEEQAVRDAIARHYFAAHATGRGEALQGWFLPEGQLMSVQDGALRTVPSATYIAGFRGTPPADEAQRRRRVAMVDVAGDAAIAKVVLEYPGVTFTDYFQLLKIGGEWKLANKSFHRQATAR